MKVDLIMILYAVYDYSNGVILFIFWRESQDNRISNPNQVDHF